MSHFKINNNSINTSISKPQNTFVQLKNKITKLIIVIIGMSGFRIDKLFSSTKDSFSHNRIIIILWAIGIILSLILAYFLARYLDFTGAIYYFAIACLFYYVGNTIFLASPLRLWMIRKYGEEKAYSLYEAILGLMFVNQGLAFAAIAEENLGILRNSPIQANMVDEIGLALIAIGFVSKTWATMIVGLDVYYYRDMFLRKVTGKFAVTGIYKYFKNPMYGIGNLQLYGVALFYFSIPGLIAAFICHISIYTFYFYAEKPAVISLHGKQVVS